MAGLLPQRCSRNQDCAKEDAKEYFRHVLPRRSLGIRAVEQLERFAIRQFDFLHVAIVRPVPGSDAFDRDCLSNRFGEVRARQPDAAIPRRRIAFECPKIGFAAITFGFHRNDDVRINPIDFRKSPGHRNPFRHVEDGRGRVVRPEGRHCEKQQDCAGSRDSVSQIGLLVRCGVAEYSTTVGIVWKPRRITESRAAPSLESVTHRDHGIRPHRRLLAVQPVHPSVAAGL